MRELSSLDAARLSDEAEIDAFRAMWAAAPPPLRDKLGLRVETVAGATLLLAPGIPSPMFNRAIGLGLRMPASADDVDSIAHVFEAAGIANWWLHWNPHASPTGMPATLEAQGYTPPQRRTWAKMLRASSQPPVVNTPLRIEPVHRDDAQAVARIAALAFGMPPFMVDWLACLHDDPWRMYAVKDGDAIVGGGCLHLGNRAGWLGIAAIAPSHRGRSGQAALMARRIADTGTAGLHWVATETGEPTSAGEANPSLANMKRCGFETVASRLNYAPPPPAG